MEIQETGTVMTVEGGRAAVRIRPERADACHGCTACRSLGGQEFVLTVPAGDLAPGDTVTLAIPLPGPWRGIALVLALPLAALMVGILGGSAWTGLQQTVGLGSEATGFLLGLALALAAFLVAILEDRRFARGHRPRVVSRMRR
jgi:positive regulator of sigma E activity